MYRLSKQVVVWSDSDLSDQSVYSQLYLLIFGKSVCCLGILSYSSYPKMCSLSDAFDVCQAILHIQFCLILMQTLFSAFYQIIGLFSRIICMFFCNNQRYQFALLLQIFYFSMKALSGQAYPRVFGISCCRNKLQSNSVSCVWNLNGLAAVAFPIPSFLLQFWGYSGGL